MFSSAADAGPYARGPRRASTLPDINTNMGDMDDSTTATESPLESDAGLSPTNGQSSDIYPVRRRATAVFAKDWQLRVLKSLYLQTARPSEEQKRVAAMETGLDTRWIASWFQRQNNPNRRGSLAYQAMCEGKIIHAPGRGRTHDQHFGQPSRTPLHRLSSTPSHLNPHAFAHPFANMPPGVSNAHSHLGHYMGGAAQYHDRLRQLEFERQRREAARAVSGDGERVPKMLIGPGTHPSMFLERRSSSSSIASGHHIDEDQAHPGGQPSARRFSLPNSSYSGAGSPSSPSESHAAGSPNPDHFPGQVSSGFAMPYGDGAGFYTVPGHSLGPFLGGPHHGQHPFLNLSRDMYHHQHSQHHGPFGHGHPHQLGPAFQLGQTAPVPHMPCLPSNLQIQYPHDIAAGHLPHDGKLSAEFPTFSSVLLNPSPYLSQARPAPTENPSHASAPSCPSPHDHGLSLPSNVVASGNSVHPELSLPQDIAAPRPVPYATYSQAASLRHDHAQPPSQPQSQHQEPQSSADHVINLLQSNAATSQWNNRDNIAGDAGSQHQFYARLGEKLGSAGVGMSELQAPFHQGQGAGVGIPYSSSGSLVRHEFASGGDPGGRDENDDRFSDDEEDKENRPPFSSEAPGSPELELRAGIVGSAVVGVAPPLGYDVAQAGTEDAVVGEDDNAVDDDESSSVSSSSE